MKNLLKDSKAYYEDNDYYEKFSQAEDAENKVAYYLNNISKNKVVLDAGCGTGKFLNVLETNAKRYIGIDLSKNQLAKAKLKSLNNYSQFICSNLTKIPLEDNSVDLIVSTWVLGTITDINERNKVLNEFMRVLNNTGSIILVENASGSEFEIIRGRDKDNRTKDYNNWIIHNNFLLEQEIDTYFAFNTIEEAIECFKTIYGDEVAIKIKGKKIEHKINIYKYQATNNS